MNTLGPDGALATASRRRSSRHSSSQHSSRLGSRHSSRHDGDTASKLYVPTASIVQDGDDEDNIASVSSSIISQVPADKAECTFTLGLLDAGPFEANPELVARRLLNSGAARVRKSDNARVSHYCFAADTLCEVNLDVCTTATHTEELKRYDGLLVLSHADDADACDRLDKAQLKIEKARGEGFPCIIVLCVRPDNALATDSCNANVRELQKVAHLHCMAFEEAKLDEPERLGRALENLVLLAYWTARNVDIVTPDIALTHYWEEHTKEQNIKRKASQEIAKLPLPPSVVKEGWLYKLCRGQGRMNRKNWASQYFTLERNVLSFSRGPDQLRNPLGMYNVKTVEDIRLDTKSSRPILVMTMPEEEIWLYAESPVETRHWYACVCAARQQQRRQSDGTTLQGDDLLPERREMNLATAAAAGATTNAQQDPLLDQNGHLKPKYKAALEHAEIFLSQASEVPINETLQDALVRGTLSVNYNSPSRVVRLFLAGGLHDFRHERTTFHTYVVPYLVLFCRNLNLEFEVVDPAWGLGSNEMQLMPDAIDLEASLVQECLDTSMSTAFVALVGSRAEPAPLPHVIPEHEYRILRLAIMREADDKTAGAAAVAFLDQWYLRDENHHPVTHRVLVDPKTRFPLFSGSRKERQAALRSWQSAQARLRQMLVRGAAQLQSEPSYARYVRSRIDQLCAVGVDQNESRGSQVTLVNRVFTDPNPEDRAASIFLIAADAIEDDRKRVERLKRRLVDLLDSTRLLQYRLDWAPGHGFHSKQHQAIITHSLETLVDSLSSDILNACTQVPHDNLLTEINEHRQHLHRMIKQTGFTRPHYLSEITTYLADSWRSTTAENDQGRPTGPLVLYGQSGAGKSWLAAHAIRAIQAENPDVIVVHRTLGLTQPSCTAKQLMLGVCEQLLRAFGKASAGLTYTLEELAQQYQRLLHLATAATPVCVVLDGLDHLDLTDGAMFSATWTHLAAALPAHARVLLTSAPQGISIGATVDVMGVLNRTAAPFCRFIEVRPLNREMLSPSAVVVLMKDVHGRSVTVDQAKSIVWAFDACPQPLHLKLLLQVAARWRSFTPFGEGPACLEHGEMGSIDATLEILLACLEDEHGEPIVARVLCALVTTKYGLSTREILRCLELDETVAKYLGARAQATPGLSSPSSVIWYRLRRDLDAILIRAIEFGVDVYKIHHGAVVDAILARYGLRDVSAQLEAHRFMALVAETCMRSVIQAEQGLNARDFSEAGQARRRGSGPNAESKRPIKLLAKRKSEKSSINILANVSGGSAALQALAARLTGPIQRGTHGMRPIGPSDHFTSAEARGALSLCHHLLEAGALTQVLEWLSDATFLAITSQHMNIDQLLQDFHRAALVIPPERLAVLHSFVAEAAPVMVTHRHASLVQQALGNHFAPREIVADMLHLARQLPVHQQRCLFVDVAPPAMHELDVNQVGGAGHGSLNKLLFSPDGRRLLCVYASKAVVVFDTASGRVEHTLTGHKNKILDGVVATDEPVLFTSAGDGVLRRWDYVAGKLDKKITIPARHGQADQLSACQDASCVAVRYSNGTLHLWSMSTNELHELREHTDVVSYCEFASSGQTLASAGRDGLVILWSARALKAMRVLRGHDGPVDMCKFHSSGTLLLSTGEDAQVKIWEVRTGRCLQTLHNRSHDAELCAFAPGFDCSQIVAASRDGSVQLWTFLEQVEGETAARPGVNHLYERTSVHMQELAVECGMTHAVMSCEFATPHLIVAATDTALAVWEARNGRRVFALPGQWPVWTITPNNRYLLAASAEGRLHVVELRPLLQGLRDDDGLDRAQRLRGSDFRLVRGPSSLLESTREEEASVLSLAYNEATKRILATCDKGAFGEYECAGEQRQRWVCSTRHITVLRWNAVSNCVATAGEDGTILVFDANTMAIAHRLQQHEGAVTAVAFRRDGRLLASVGVDGACHLWDLSTGLLRRSLAPAGGQPLHACRFAPDGEHLALSDNQGRVRIVHAESGQPSHEMHDHHDTVTCLGFAVMGQHLASGGNDHDVCVYSLGGAGRLYRRLTGHRGPVVGVEFVPRPRSAMLLSAALDGVVKMWDAAAGLELVSFMPTGAPLTAMSGLFTSEEDRLQFVVGDVYGRIRCLRQLTSFDK